MCVCIGKRAVPVEEVDSPPLSRYFQLVLVLGPGSTTFRDETNVQYTHVLSSKQNTHKHTTHNHIVSYIHKHRTHIRTHTGSNLHTRTHIRTRTGSNLHTRTHICTRTGSNLHTRTHKSCTRNTHTQLSTACVYTYTYIHTCTYTYTYVHIYIRIHNMLMYTHYKHTTYMDRA